MAHPELGRRSPHHPPHRPAHSPRRKAHGRGGKIAALATIAILALWAGATTLYVYFHDDALAYLVAHQTEMVRSYDGQLAALENEVARLKSLKLIEQERVDHVVSDLARRQVEVEQRQNKLTDIAAKEKRRSEPSGNASDIMPSVRPTARPDIGIMPKPSPISDRFQLRPQFDRATELRAREREALDSSRPVAARIASLGSALDRIETRQNQTLQQFEKSFSGRETKMREVLADLGIAAPAPATALAEGGPFIPLKAGEHRFDQRMARVEETATAISDLNRVLDFVPVRYPVPRNSDITSPFGVRTDPFLHQAALHSGIDFRGSPGEPARATAAGVVTNASYRGGYGLMVEIDHGHGLVTRYGHLSAINVVEGQRVQAGEAVGRIGSTGRSTGPHLHYEVRVKGEPIDPQRYLHAGLPLAD